MYQFFILNGKFFRTARKTELNPTPAQVEALVKGCGTNRFAYNWGLKQRIVEYKITGKSSNAIEQHKQLNAIKATDFPWMYEVSKCIPQEALRDLDKAYQNFYNGIASFPKFKSKKNSLGSFRLTGSITITDHRIKLPRIGTVKLKESNYLPPGYDPTSVTISEKAGRFFISVPILEEREVPECTGEVRGIDVGLTNYTTDQAGSKVNPLKPLANNQKKLRILARRLNKKPIGTKNRRKAAKRLAKLHYRIVCQRSDFIHKNTTSLAKTKSVIGGECLNIAGMLSNHSLAQAISDAAWGTFYTQLQYKCLWYGSVLIQAPTFYPSSKICSRCGVKNNELRLSDRVFRCPSCDYVINRDKNAGINLAQYAATASRAGSPAA